ncbi:MAG: hypothetical protein AB8B65_11975 [Kordia sp.]|uniref:hypothetical protein n=1 Tax=Kordia sp. TaxID=1965332 RepID=UPI00385875DB
MQHYTVTITAREPLVLRTQSGSEVQSDVVDYVQGAKLLGLVAKQSYAALKTQNKDAVYELFHAGNVRFGNAYPICQQQVGLPVPFSLYKTKDAEGNNSFTFSPTGNHKKKQQKEGFVIAKDAQLSLFTVPQGERLKSARDLENRRSKDKEMYLYSYLKRGVQFQSTISVKKPSDEITEAIQNLNGSHYIGTSKGEFGYVTIEVSETAKVEEVADVKGKQIIIYAWSDLIFLNEFGRYTTQINAADFEITNAKLTEEDSFIQFKSFHTYNSKRRNEDADRIAIKKGSVLVFESTEDNQDIEISAQTINEGVGVHKSEGFGQILVNPEFLHCEVIKETTEGIRLNLMSEAKDVESDFLKQLSQRNEIIQKDHATYEEAKKFIKDHKTLFEKTTKSQWGAIRNYVLEAIASENPKESLREKLTDTKKGYLREKANANWSRPQADVIERLFEKSNAVALLLKICVELPKTLKND